MCLDAEGGGGGPETPANRNRPQGGDRQETIAPHPPMLMPNQGRTQPEQTPNIYDVRAQLDSLAREVRPVVHPPLAAPSRPVAPPEVSPTPETALTEIALEDKPNIKKVREAIEKTESEDMIEAFDAFINTIGTTLDLYELTSPERESITLGILSHVVDNIDGFINGLRGNIGDFLKSLGDKKGVSAIAEKFRTFAASIQTTFTPLFEKLPMTEAQRTESQYKPVIDFIANPANVAKFGKDQLLTPSTTSESVEDFTRGLLERSDKNLKRITELAGKGKGITQMIDDLVLNKPGGIMTEIARFILDLARSFPPLKMLIGKFLGLDSVNSIEDILDRDAAIKRASLRNLRKMTTFSIPGSGVIRCDLKRIRKTQMQPFLDNYIRIGHEPGGTPQAEEIKPDMWQKILCGDGIKIGERVFKIEKNEDKIVASDFEEVQSDSGSVKKPKNTFTDKIKKLYKIFPPDPNPPVPEPAPIPAPVPPSEHPEPTPAPTPEPPPTPAPVPHPTEPSPVPTPAQPPHLPEELTPSPTPSLPPQPSKPSPSPIPTPEPSPTIPQPSPVVQSTPRSSPSKPDRQTTPPTPSRTPRPTPSSSQPTETDLGRIDIDKLNTKEKILEAINSILNTAETRVKELPVGGGKLLALNNIKNFRELLWKPNEKPNEKPNFPKLINKIKSLRDTVQAQENLQNKEELINALNRFLALVQKYQTLF